MEKATEIFADRLKVSIREYYFEEFQAMVGVGIQYDEKLELEETMLQETSGLIEEEVEKLFTKRRFSYLCYVQWKIDVETVFGYIKAILRFNSCNSRSNSRVKPDIGLALMRII